MNRLLSLLAIFTIGLLLGGCSCDNEPETAPTTAPKERAELPNKEYSVLSVLWHQQAAECRALAYQAFNIARVSLDDKLAKVKLAKPAAVVVDIDETLLDNSPYNAKLITTDEDYNSDSWKAWTDLAMADTIPGAVSFLKYAASKGVEIFYVSNRKVREQEATIKNLQKFGFPMADDAHFHLRSDERSKEPRRTTIAETHTILLLMGDNLGDFAEIFDGGSTEDRALAVDEMRHEFGDRFIVLPNAMYGTWEGTLYQSYDLSTAQKDSIRKAALKIY